MSEVAAVTALVDRDFRGFFRSRSQLYSSILFPLMLLAVIGAGVTDGLDPRNVDDYVTYLVPGMIVMTSLFSSTFSSASYYADRDSGILRVLLASPHSPRVILLGKTLSAVIIGTTQALVVLVIAALLPAVDFSWQYATGSFAVAIAVVVLLNLFLCGLGQWLASRIRTMQGFHLVMNLVLFPFLFFSGAFFPLDELPAWLYLLGRINPLSYAVDALLLALYADGSDGYFGLAIDFAVLIILSALVFWVGTGRQVTGER
jgi:ABC-2 type transport system permease protein